MGKWKQRLALAVGGPTVLLGGAELSLRAFGFRYEPAVPDIILTNVNRDAAIERGSDMFQRSRDALWELRPGAPISSLPVGAEPEFIGASGFRGLNEDTLGEEQTVVACLGDSSTFGVYVTGTETYPARLEAELRRERSDVRVLNAGCVGYTVLQGLQCFRERLLPLGVDVIVLSFGCVNESLPSKFYDDETKLAQLQLRESGSYRAWSRVRSLRLVQLLEQVLPPDEPTNLGEWLERSGQNIPTPQRRATGDFQQRVSPSRFEELLRVFVAEAREAEVGVVLVSPSRLPAMESKQPFVIEYSQAIQRVAESEGLPSLDLRARWRAQGRPPEELHLPGDQVHPNAEGHALWARELAPLVRALLPVP